MKMSARQIESETFIKEMPGFGAGVKTFRPSAFRPSAFRPSVFVPVIGRKMRGP